MTTSIATNANTNVQQQQMPNGAELPDFRPSYNAVQLNISQPRCDVAPLMPPAPPTATQQWNA